MTVMGLNYLVHEETKRSNLAKEGETMRHNVQTENLGTLSYFENVRTNKANESIKQGSLEESIRSNLVNENLKLGTLHESIRSNLAKEKETNRSNLAKELETNRASVAKEGIDVYKSELGVFENVAPLSALYTTNLFNNKGSYVSVASERVGNVLLGLLPTISKTKFK